MSHTLTSLAALLVLHSGHFKNKTLLGDQDDFSVFVNGYHRLALGRIVKKGQRFVLCYYKRQGHLHP